METVSEDTKAVLKKSEHFLWEYQDEITHRMYEIMFERYPETKKLFKEFRKQQPNIFGAALMCHFVSLDKPEALQSFRIGICQSHVRAGIKEEHYSMMADSLFSAMEEVLKEHATKEVIKAWEKWFFFVANLLIEREREHYQGKHLLFPETVA